MLWNEDKSRRSEKPGFTCTFGPGKLISVVNDTCQLFKKVNLSFLIIYLDHLYEVWTICREILTVYMGISPIKSLLVKQRVFSEIFNDEYEYRYNATNRLTYNKKNIRLQCYIITSQEFLICIYTKKKKKTSTSHTFCLYQ